MPGRGEHRGPRGLSRHLRSPRYGHGDLATGDHRSRAFRGALLPSFLRRQPPQPPHPKSGDHGLVGDQEPGSNRQSHPWRVLVARVHRVCEPPLRRVAPSKPRVPPPQPEDHPKAMPRQLCLPRAYEKQAQLLTDGRLRTDLERAAQPWCSSLASTSYS